MFLRGDSVTLQHWSVKRRLGPGRWPLESLEHVICIAVVFYTHTHVVSSINASTLTGLHIACAVWSCMITVWLVGGFKHFLFSILYGYIWDNHPNWLIFFRGVENINQMIYILTKLLSTELSRGHPCPAQPQVRVLWCVWHRSQHVQQCPAMSRSISQLRQLQAMRWYNLKSFTSMCNLQCSNKLRINRPEGCVIRHFMGQM